LLTTFVYFFKIKGPVTQQLLNKGSSFSSKKLAILDKKLAQITSFYPQKRAQKRAKRVTIFTCHFLKSSSNFN